MDQPPCPRCKGTDTFHDPPAEGSGEPWLEQLISSGACSCTWDVADDPTEANKDGDKIVRPDPQCLIHAGVLPTLTAEREARRRAEGERAAAAELFAWIEREYPKALVAAPRHLLDALQPPPDQGEG